MKECFLFNNISTNFKEYQRKSKKIKKNNMHRTNLCPTQALIWIDDKNICNTTIS